MAGVTVGAESTYIEKLTRTLVEARASLTDSWAVVRFAEALEVNLESFPGGSSARCQYRYGKIVPEKATSFISDRPTSLLGQQVRIRSRYTDGGGWVTRFAGIVPRETLRVGGREIVQTGDQAVDVLGIEHLLKSPLRSSVWEHSGTWAAIDAVDSFNERSSGGTIRGNRSATLYGTPPAYVFSRGSDAVPWSSADIIRYLLAWLAPSHAPLFVLSGQVEILEQFYPVLEVNSSSTILGLINELIDPRRGVQCRCVWYGGETAELVVSSVADQEIHFGGFYLPRNPAVTDLDLETGRTTEDVTITLDASQQVRTLTVRGAPLRVSFSMEVAAGNLEAGWSDAAEILYHYAGNENENYDALVTADPAIAKIYSDKLRRDATSPLIRSVYTKFRIPDAWDWTLPARTISDDVFAIDTGGNAYHSPRTIETTAANVLPYVTDYGLIDSAVAQPAPSRIRRFLRDTVLYKGMDYTVDPPVNRGLDTDKEEVEPLMVFLKGPNILQNDVTVFQYYDVSNGGKTTWPTASVSIADDELALYVRTSPVQHLLGLTHFKPAQDGEPVPNGNPTQNVPLVNWQTMVATVAVDTNQHIEYRQQLSTSAVGLDLVIEIPEAAVWVAAPGTVIGLATDNALKRVPPGNYLITRNDRDWLVAVFCLAKAWHSRARVGLDMTLSGIGGVPMPGVMLANVNASLGRPVASYTNVSSVRYDFESGKTSVRTGFEGMDFRALGREVISASLGGRRSAGMSQAVGGAGRSGSANGIDGLPIRWPNPGQAATTTTGGGTGEDATSIVAVSPFLRFFGEP